MYTTETVENQEVMWLPTNKETQTISYNTCFLKSSIGRYPALKWKVSKVEDTATLGISRFTMTQEQFDADKDNAELMIANYYEDYIDEIPDCTLCSQYKIVCSGNASVRAGGGYKKFTLKKVVGDELLNVAEPITWHVNSGFGDDKINIISEFDFVKIKIVNDYSLIGELFVLNAEVENSKASIEVEVTSL